MVLARIATLKERAAAALAEFLRLESAGGVLLLGMAMLGLAAANSPLAMLYGRLLSLPFTVKLGSLGVDKPLLLWINDGLMAVFFLLVALGLKRETAGPVLRARADRAARDVRGGRHGRADADLCGVQPRQRRGHGRCGDPGRHRYRVRARHPRALG